MDNFPVIGMSPGNSYFKDEVVKELLKKVVDKYGKTAVLIADVPAISTYVALGYSANRARRDKALPQGNALKNKVLKAMSELGYTHNQIRIIDWDTEIEENNEYQEKYDKVTRLYNTNTLFQEEAHNATKSVIEYSGKKIPDIVSAIRIAVHYLLSEIAFLELAPTYLEAEKVVYVYHKSWPVYESYIAGEFDKIPKNYLGLDIINVCEE